jgi:hypothetical protein
MLQSPCAGPQIVNTTDLRLSSTTPLGEGIAEFVQLVAATAMGMPHVKQCVPKSYVDLGVQLQTWARRLWSAQLPPVCTRDEVFGRVKKNYLLSHRLVDRAACDHALYFLAGGGALVLAPDEDTVILDPGWLTDSLACAITADPARLSKLPPALAQRGILRHDDIALAAVWPDSKRYTVPLRAGKYASASASTSAAAGCSRLLLAFTFFSKTMAAAGFWLQPAANLPW